MIPNLSIIIPIYNVEKYLSVCLESIVSTIGFERIEILLVDDGSTDQSGIIADSYAKTYENITVFHKINGGLSDARNYGLIKATGKYVFFLDSDDFINGQYLQDFIPYLVSFDGDCLLWDAEIVDESGNQIKADETSYFCHLGLENGKTYDGENLIKQQLLDHKDFVTTVWLGAYSREFLLTNQFWFEKDLLHEDELWTPKVLLKAKKITYFAKPVYKYRVRQNSIMTGNKKNRSKNIASLIYAFASMEAYYDWKIEENSLRKLVKANLSRRYLHKISEYNLYSYRKLSMQINKWSILKNASGAKDKLRALILLINGRLYCFVTKFVRE